MKSRKVSQIWISLFLVFGIGFRVVSVSFDMPLTWRTWALLSLFGATTFSIYVIVFQHLRRIFQGASLRDIMNEFRELWHLLVDPEQVTGAYEIDDWESDED